MTQERRKPAKVDSYSEEYRSSGGRKEAENLIKMIGTLEAVDFKLDRLENTCKSLADKE